MGGEKKVILVSGASSGLGYAVAKRLSDDGHTVYAAARSYKTEDPSNQAIEKRTSLCRIYMDVTDQSGIDEAIRLIMEREKRLDAVVNCAAQIVLGSVEDTGIDEYRKVLETNFLGTVRVCKGALPFMRGAGKGLIINFSSINGLLATPFQSAYVASKFAIEGMTECLSMELKEFGIKTVLIEPSDHRSGSKTYREHAAKAESADSCYYGTYKKVTGKIEHDEATGSDPAGAAALVSKIISKHRPGLRYTVGKFDQRLSVVLKKLLPGRWFESMIRGYYIKK